MKTLLFVVVLIPEVQITYTAIYTWQSTYEIRESIMSLMDWSSELSVGIDSIDDQHKKLISMLNALYDAMQAGEGKAMVGKVLGGLAAYTVNHFKYEEDLFDKHGYPDAAEHKKQHADLLAQVTEIKAKFDSGSGSTTLSMEILKFLKSWLVDHIQGTDQAYTSFLVAKGVK